MEYLISQKDVLNIDKKHIIELGAGTGITGLNVARNLNPKSLLLTDLPDTVPLLSANITMNNLHHSVSAMAYDWDKGKVGIHDRGDIHYSLVIASDVVYYPEGYEPLVKTIEILLRKENPVEMVIYYYILKI